jgi:hypothetical protein
MQIFCSLVTLMFINGACLSISFNMESVLEQSIEDDTTEIVLMVDYSANFDLADLLDLDIFDFDVDELENRYQQDEYMSKYSPELTL